MSDREGGEFGGKVGAGAILPAFTPRPGAVDLGSVEEVSENLGPPGTPIVIVEVAVLLAHAGHVGGVTGRIGAEHREIGVEEDRCVAAVDVRSMLGRFDHRCHSLRSVAVPAERGEITSSKAGTGAFVGRIRRLVHRIVIEGSGDDLVEVVDRLGRREFLDVAEHPGHMGHRVIATVLLAVPGEETFEEALIGADAALPRNGELQLRLVHRASVPSADGSWQGDGVAILIDDARWWWKGRKWCHLVSDTSYDELHDFADRAGVPRRGFQGDHYDIPEEYRAELIAAGAELVESRELVRRLRGGGLRLSPAERRARTASP